jgi:hypothetical protein
VTTTTGSRGRLIQGVGILLLIIGIGFGGVDKFGGASTHSIAHKAVLDVLVRALFSGVIVVFVVGVGVLLGLALRRPGRRGGRLLPNLDDSFPLWLRLLVTAAAIFFLAFLGFLFVLLAPRRKHQKAAIEHLGNTAPTRRVLAPPGLDHFNYLVPILVGVVILIALGVGAFLRRRRLRQRNLGRLQHLSERGPTARVAHELGELSTIDDPHDKVYACWDYVEARLGGIGLDRHRFESPTEFAKRVNRSLPFPALELQTIASLFVEARYSNHVIDAKDADLACTLTVLLDAACDRVTTHA